MSKLFIKLIFVGGFFTYLASYGFYKEHSFRLFFYYLAISLLCFFAYGLDKYLAKKGAWRLAEKYLHFSSLIGGWPGALIGQEIFHHKTQKKSFRLLFCITLLINVVVLVSFTTPLLKNLLELINPQIID